MQLDWADISGWTAFGALATALLTLVLTGRLIPRRIHKDTLEERNLWRTAAEVKDDTISELVTQQRIQRVVGQTQTAILQNLPQMGGSDDAED